MNKLVLLASSLAIVSPLPAQGWTTSPRGYLTVEGETRSSLFGIQAALRYQQIDTTNSNPLNNRRRYAFRRDGAAPTNLIFASRTVELELLMSESNLRFVSTNFDCNHKTNTAVVFNRKFVNFPDWTVRPPSAPATQDLILLADTIWSYPGKTASGNDLLWEVKIWSNTGAGQAYPADYAVPNPFAQVASRSAGSALGVGCLASGHASPSRLDTRFVNTRSGFILDVEVKENADNQFHFLLMGFLQQSVAVPILCAPFHITGPLLTNPVGFADSGGNVDTCFRLGHDASGIGLPLIMQAFALDPSQQVPFLPIALTDGNRTVIPADPTGPRAPVGHLFSVGDPDTANIAQFGPRPGGIILLSNDV